MTQSPLLGEVLNDLLLGGGYLEALVHDLHRGHGETVADGRGVGGLDALFRDVGHIPLIEAVLLGDELDDLVIVAMDAQLLGQALAQLAAAGAEFTADGDDFHDISTPLKGSKGDRFNTHSSCRPRTRGRWSCGEHSGCAAEEPRPPPSSGLSGRAFPGTPASAPGGTGESR